MTAALRWLEERFQTVPPVGCWGALVLYSALIFAASSGSSTGIRLPVSGLDKAVHFVVYAVWALLGLAALSRQFPRLSLRRRAVLAALGAAAYGLSDELHQMFVPGRHADPLDWLADVAGAAAAVATCGALARLRGPAKTA